MMDGMISEKSTRVLVASFMIARLSLTHVFGAESAITEMRYWTGESNIVATVSAYERLTRLPSGETVPYFSTEIDSLCTNYTAIVFYVLSPPEYAGKYFRLGAIPPEPLSGSLPLAYNFGELYYFGLLRARIVSDGLPSADHKNDRHYWSGITPDELTVFSSSISGRMNVGTITGTPYYATVKKAQEALNALEKKQREMEAEIETLSAAVEKTKLEKGEDYKNDTDYRRQRGRLSNLQRGGLFYNENRQKEARMQIEQLGKMGK